MKLKEIFAITGKPGLYKLLSGQKMPMIVESLEDGKRLPIFARDKVVALGDISMYTETGDKPLGEILEELSGSRDHKPLDTDQVLRDEESLRNFMESVLPDYDRERVRIADIKKLAKWYNILVGAGMTTFVDAPEPSDSVEEKVEE